MKFIPATKKSKNSIYYNYNYLNSFGTKIRAIIGARGIGKTYGAKKYIISHFLNNAEKFIWIRDTESACDELAYNDGEKFFSDIKKEFNGLEGKIQGYLITINNHHCGYLMPASTYYNYKGNSFDDCKNIIFDEFIPESGQRSIGNRTRQFLNTIETIGRLRTDYRIFLLANAINRGSEILSLFGVKVKDFGVYVNREKDFVLHYVENSEGFNQARECSISGKILKGTIYEENISNGSFMDDIGIYFDKLPNKASLLFSIVDSLPIRVYFKGNMFYIKFDNGKRDICKRVVKAKNNVSDSSVLDCKFVNELKKAQSESRVRFENGAVYNEFISLFF